MAFLWQAVTTAGVRFSWRYAQKETFSYGSLRGKTKKKTTFHSTKPFPTAALCWFNVFLSSRSRCEGEEYLKAGSLCHSLFTVRIFTMDRLEKFSFTPFLSPFFHNIENMHMVMGKIIRNHSEHERSEYPCNT